MTRTQAMPLVLSCEHGGYRVPPAHRELFAGAGAVLRSHRGWDRGALVLARALARRFDAPLFEATVTRLLVDLNRAESNRAVFSTFSRQLPPEHREALLDRHHRAHRRAVRDAVAQRIGSGQCVVHVSVHSFTPELDGRRRGTDIGLLYDPARAQERLRAAAWKGALKVRLPQLEIHRNAPYRGTSDGLTRWLRTQFSERDYAGIELELNQKWIEESTWASIRRAVAESMAVLVGG